MPAQPFRIKRRSGEPSRGERPLGGHDRKAVLDAGRMEAPIGVRLRSEIKALIVSELNLKGRDPETIEDDAPLFGPAAGGLGLDSLDALQLAMAIEEKLGVRIPDAEEARAIFRSVRSIATHVAQVRGG